MKLSTLYELKNVIISSKFNGARFWGFRCLRLESRCFSLESAAVLNTVLSATALHGI
jgi:hypothetical protein